MYIEIFNEFLARLLTKEVQILCWSFKIAGRKSSDSSCVMSNESLATNIHDVPAAHLALVPVIAGG